VALPTLGGKGREKRGVPGGGKRRDTTLLYLFINSSSPASKNPADRGEKKRKRTREKGGTEEGALRPSSLILPGAARRKGGDGEARRRIPSLSLVPPEGMRRGKGEKKERKNRPFASPAPWGEGKYSERGEDSRNLLLVVVLPRGEGRPVEQKGPAQTSWPPLCDYGEAVERGGCALSPRSQGGGKKKEKPLVLRRGEAAWREGVAW